jgi:UDP-2,3-diacylglucosamine hydrolase
VTQKKTYFLSDFHLGVSARTDSRTREQQIVRFLDSIAADAAAIYIIGDVFEFWFEYQSAVPKGFVRLFGKLATLRDAGIPIYHFKGNHDMWEFGYLESELGLTTFPNSVVHKINGKTFFIAHGDGLGPGDTGYKILKKIFRNPICQWLFARIHPNFGIALARYCSAKSRDAQPESENGWLGDDKEWLVAYANRKLDSVAADFFVFGHRHLPIDYMLKNKKSRYINTGEWLWHNSYAVFDGQDMKVCFFENPDGVVFPKK